MVIESEVTGICLKCKAIKFLSKHHIVPRREILRFSKINARKTGWPGNSAPLCRECHLDYEEHSQVQTYVKRGTLQTTLLALWHVHFNRWLLGDQCPKEIIVQENADQAGQADPAYHPAKPVSAEEVGDIVAGAMAQNFVKATNQRDSVMRDTLKHCRDVGHLLGDVIAELHARSIEHDQSKFDSAEFDAFVEATPKLKSSAYGSEEYNRTLQDIAPALKHHYENNSHHPEFHRLGIRDMSLIDLIEMLCDWKAATARHSDGSLARSFEVNRDRFGIPSELYAILVNTAKQLDWID